MFMVQDRYTILFHIPSTYEIKWKQKTEHSSNFMCISNVIYSIKVSLNCVIANFKQNMMITKSNINSACLLTNWYLVLIIFFIMQKKTFQKIYFWILTQTLVAMSTSIFYLYLISVSGFFLQFLFKLMQNWTRVLAWKHSNVLCDHLIFKTFFNNYNSYMPLHILLQFRLWSCPLYALFCQF